MKNKEKCVICSELIIGFGNNPEPIKKNGKCCDNCNSHKVIPARLGIISINFDK